MESAGIIWSGPQWPDARRFLRRHPESAAGFVVVTTWVVLLFGEGGVQPVAHAHPTGAFVPASASFSGVLPMVAWGLPHWILMTISMMGPAALAGVRHTGLNSLYWRRGRAMAEFSFGYLSVWTFFGIGVLALTAFAPSVVSWPTTALALGMAAAWQWSPFKRRSLRGCHQSVPLPPYPWRAEIGALRFGIRNGASCLGSCWLLMLVMAVAPGAHLLWTVALTGIVTTERLLERPRRAIRWAALGLGTASIVAAAVSLF